MVWVGPNFYSLIFQQALLIWPYVIPTIPYVFAFPTFQNIIMKVEFDSIIENMKVQKESSFLPLDIAIKYYQKWDCDISCQVDESIYYKCLNGNGSVEFLNGNTYVGSFKNGFMHGKGSYRWKNGLLYEGEISKNTITGQGKLKWLDGSYYVGSVVEGKRDSFGEYYCSVDKSTYKGMWVKGIKEGKGVLIFSNGAVYQGDFKAGVREGYGKMKYQSGNEYEGTWKADKKEGKGVMNWYTTLEKYDGQWKDDFPSGLGSYFWFEGKSQSKSIKTIYKGEWKAGKRQGFGTFYYNNGCRLQGTFSNNMKEGLCFLVDEFGEGHLETFKLDKSILKKQEIALKEEKKHFKLPELPQSKKQNILQNNEPADNNYSKFIDFQCPLIDEPIYNVLLRENSQLRQWYRTIITNLNKEIFNGLNIEGLWRLVRDMKLTDENITIAKLNREFFKGYKSRFQVDFTNKAKLQLIKSNCNLLNSHNYYCIEWQAFFQDASKLNLNWENWQQALQARQIDVEKIDLNRELNIHSNNHIILYRHFIVYILHLTLLQHQQSQTPTTFRKCLEDLFTSIKIAMNPVSAFKTEKNCSEILTNVSHNQSKLHISEDYSTINRGLFELLCKDKPQLMNRIDRTVTVKQIYCLLCQLGLLKEPSEKMLFLEKIERNMNVKSSLLKKENKIYYQSIEKVLLKSPYFSHILNYEMIESEFDEILYVFLNRKIGNTQSKEEFLQKYKEVIRSIANLVSKVREDNATSKRSVAFNYKRYSAKDRQKDQFLRKLQEERQMQLAEEARLRELKREERERVLMKREDSDIKDEDLSEESDEYYD